MRFVDLNPEWYGAGGEGVRDKDGNPVPQRRGVGVQFDCPCGSGTCLPCYIPFENPLDGGPSRDVRTTWRRQGETFETLTLTPSILRVGGCAWHGFVTNGEVLTA